MKNAQVNPFTYADIAGEYLLLIAELEKLPEEAIPEFLEAVKCNPNALFICQRALKHIKKSPARAATHKTEENEILSF